MDTGNFSDNPTPEGDAKTEALIDGMSRLGYAAVGVGERDLSMGYDEFAKKTAGARFPFVSANLVRKDTKEPVFKPSVVVEAKRGGGKPPVRVGLIGLARFNPVFLKAGPGGSNVTIAPPAESLRRYVGEIRKDADVVVLLAALSRDDAHQLARDVPGIDLIFGAYGGMYNAQEESEGATRILYTGNQGKRIGETRVFLDANRHVVSQESYVYFLTARYPDDPQMLKYVQDALARIKGTASPASAGAASPSAPPAGGRSGAGS